MEGVGGKGDGARGQGASNTDDVTSCISTIIVTTHSHTLSLECHLTSTPEQVEVSLKS